MKGPKVAEGLVVKKEGDLYLFLNPLKPDWFVGYPKAAATVRLMDGTRSFDEIVEELKGEFDIPESAIREDANELIRLMEDKKMMSDSGPQQTEEMTDFKLQMMWLHVTHRCNLRCRYCYITGGEALEKELSTDEIVNLIDQFHEMGDGHQTIAISGGEPLMRDDLWEIVAHARKLSISLILATNGMLVDEENSRKIKENFKSVQVSLDGPREKHDEMRGRGSYDGAVRAIKLLTEAGIKPSVSAVVTKNNIEELGELARIAHEYGLESVKSPPLLEIGKGRACLAPTLAELARAWWAMDRVTRQLKSDVPMDNTKSAAGPVIRKNGYSCGAGIDSISVDSDGSIYPCQGAQFPEFFAGNIRDERLEDIWKGAKVFGEWRTATVDKMRGCSACEWRNYCGGGCRLHAVAAHGTIFAPDGYCGMHKRMIEESIWTSILRKMGRNYDPDERWARAVEDFEALAEGAHDSETITTREA